MLPIRLFALALFLATLTPRSAHAQTDCRPAVAQAWAYPVAEGQTTLRDFLTGVMLMVGAQPSDVEGWQYSGRPPACVVTFRYRAQGAPVTLRYQVDTASGGVEPADDLTRTTSGW